VIDVLQLSEAEYSDYVGLMQQCWAQEPQDRPAFPDIIGELR